MALSTVVEFKVDEDALVDRIAKRAEETAARGQPVRKDDTPEVFKTRLEAYRRQTAPLSAYYAKTGMLRAIDGMKPIDTVTEEVMLVLESHVEKAPS
jgi:adenylate kinase